MLANMASSVGKATRTVAVVGLGKIGLPLAAQFAAKNLNVIGCDVVPDVVAAVNSGRSHILEEAGLDAAVKSAVANQRLRATQDTTAAVKEADVVVVIVPLLVDQAHKIDFKNLDSATAAIARGLHRGSLVIYETTLPVGTTRNRLAPLLEKGSGLSAGKDFLVAFSPERLYAGRIFEDLRRYPKIVGGIDEASTARAVEFYRQVLDADVRAVENAETAEFAKLAETTYRDVNIALANELATYGAARGVNIREAIDAANSQPFSHIHRPSIGVGGHCIPVYPHFLLDDAKKDELELVRTGRATNDAMVDICVARLERFFGSLDGRTVLVLGASYRENVKELAFSTAIPLIAQLRSRGAKVLLNDPLFTDEELAGLGAQVVGLDGDGGAIAADAIVLQAFHEEYRRLRWTNFDGLRAIFDGRGALDPVAVAAQDLVYLSVDTAPQT